MKRLAGYFLQGLLYLGPITLTVYIIVEVFNFVDGILKQLIKEVVGYNLPGLGLLIILVLLTLLGYFGQTVLAHPFKLFLNRVILRIPPINLIYSSLNDLFSAIVGKEKKFNKPVLVKINESSTLERIGFITEDDLSKYGLHDKVAVYFPFSYSISGELMIVSGKYITPLKIPASVALKFIVSGGVTDIEADS